MNRLFLPPDQFSGDNALILGTDHRHLTLVLRARVGDSVILLDGLGNAFLAVLVSIGKAETTARIKSQVAISSEPPIAVTVAQALGKGDKFEQVIQHGTEAGASAFVPVRAERCVVAIPAAKVTDRVARWRQIAKGAAEQSGRARVPGVVEPKTFSDVLKMTLADSTLALLLHPAEGTTSLASVLMRLPEVPAQVILCVGPEGGWSPAEVSAAVAANVTPVTLGPRVLRTETAALVAVSQILYHFETIGL